MTIFNRYSLVAASALALTLSACNAAPENDGDAEAVATNDPATTEGAGEGEVGGEMGAEVRPSETAVAGVGEQPVDQTQPSPYSTGRPGQPAIPETREDPNWTARYSPDIPYYNRSSEAVPATMGASPRTGLVGQVQPGEGGFIQTCELNSTYCKISFGGAGKAGYVNMDLMSGEAR